MSVDGETLIADLCARGVWEPQAMALLDIHVVDTNTKSYQSHFPVVMLASAKDEKNRKYCDGCTMHHATFTPLCFSVDGLVDDEAACFLKHLTRSLSVTWEHHYGEVIRWLQT